MTSSAFKSNYLRKSGSIYGFHVTSCSRHGHFFLTITFDHRNYDLEKQQVYVNPVQFYDFFTNRVLVQFKPLSDNMATCVEFDLLLSKKMTYDQMAGRVGEKLQYDPMKLRFTNSHQGNPKTVIRRAAAQGTVADMIQSSYTNAPSNVLFYELLEMSIVEIETKRNVKVTWTGAHNRDEVNLALSR